MDTEILILGGGPSGLSTALHLIKIAPHLASKILILEKEHYPRPKLCAGGLVIDAEVILERLGLDVRELPHVDAQNVHFDFAGRGLNVRVLKRHAIRIIRRDEFDHWLAVKTREAGIEIREGIKVNQVFPNENGVSVITDQGEFHAEIVVGADGSNGVTRRCILPNEPVYTARVLEVITPNYPHRPSGASPKFSEFKGGREGVAYFDFLPVPNNIAGYTWDFPTQVNSQPMRCWGIYDMNILSNCKRPALKESLAEELKRHGFELGDYEIKGHPIRWYSPQNKASVPRVLLVGDAVGADPIFGEGISVERVSRGGDITYHGPGQLVGYPIVLLARPDVHRFVRSVEGALIASLAEFGVSADRIDGLTGVWAARKKIASIGIGVRRWVTYHGFALNVSTDLSYFRRIHLCGLPGREATSVAEACGREIPMDAVREAVALHCDRRLRGFS